MIKRYKVRVPASTSNLGPGFDCLGAALTLYNEIEAIVDNKRAVFTKIEIEGEGAASLPKDERNIVWQSMKKVFERHTYKKCSLNNLRLHINNYIPIASGLGSSAAARLGGILLAYKIMGLKANIDEVLKLGAELEGHPDNIVPALVGGLCVSMVADKQIKYIKLSVPRMKAVIANPYFELKTKKARKALPKNIPFSNAVFNVSRSLVMLSALQKNRFDLLKDAMEDKMHQPYREKLVPGMKNVFNSAYTSGAYGAALSGAGPSIVAFCSINKAEKVAGNMTHAWKMSGINSRSYILDFDKSGAK